jgi:D-tagatose-1,6-bisphosphate aldolase subunit GatZ/KbaZ
LALLSQFMPAEYQAIREGRLALNPRDLLMHAVARVLAAYAQACQPRAA